MKTTDINEKSMSSHYDNLETRNPAAREAALMAALPGQIAHARSRAPAFAESLKDIDPAAVTSRAALARLPVIRKHELLERQQAQRASDVFGGFSALRFGKNMARVFASPGPIYEPEGQRVDYWRMARGLISAPAFARATWCTTASATTSHLPAP